MTLHVPDTSIDELADKARRILKVKTREEAIRLALERVVERDAPDKAAEKPRGKAPTREWLDELRQQYNLPPYESLEPFDDKAFLDEMWGHDDIHR